MNRRNWFGLVTAALFGAKAKAKGIMLTEQSLAEWDEDHRAAAKSKVRFSGERGRGGFRKDLDCWQVTAMPVFTVTRRPDGEWPEVDMGVFGCRVTSRGGAVDVEKESTGERIPYTVRIASSAPLSFEWSPMEEGPWLIPAQSPKLYGQSVTMQGGVVVGAR